MSDEPDVVWQNTVDQGAWAVRVNRIDEYRGELIVTRAATGEEVYRDTVGLAYGARFGPDVDDVAVWQEKCIEVIDQQPQEEKS